MSEGEEQDDPNDPRHPDHDLSEEAAYEFDDYSSPYRPWFGRRWVLLLVGVILILALILPFVR